MIYLCIKYRKFWVDILDFLINIFCLVRKSMLNYCNFSTFLWFLVTKTNPRRHILTRRWKIWWRMKSYTLENSHLSSHKYHIFFPFSTIFLLLLDEVSRRSCFLDGTKTFNCGYIWHGLLDHILDRSLKTSCIFLK